MHPLLASMFPVPQKYFVPRRIRDTYIPRLEAVGLWNLPVEEKVKEKKSLQNQQKGLSIGDIKSNTTVSQAFQSEKVYSFFPIYSSISECYEQVIVKARAELEIYNQLLSGKEYVFQNRYVPGVFRMFGRFILINRLSSIDVIIAAHILLLVNPPFPGSLIKDLVNNSYPALVSYAQRIYDRAFEEGHSPIQFTSPSSSLWSLIPSWPKASDPSRISKSQEDIYYNRMSLGFIGLAIGSLTAYLVVVGSQARKILKVLSEEMEEIDVSEGETPE